MSETVASDALPMWVVYDHPRDRPDVFIARLHLICAGCALASDQTLEADSIAALREKLPPGLVRLARDPSDDPVIVETWL